MRTVVKKVALALGGGSARGFAHIGVLKVFENENIPIDCVAGTSMGAIVGSLYCAGMGLQMLERLAHHLQRSHWMDFTFPRMGLASGDKLEQLLMLLTRRKTFAQLDKPFAVVAADLITGSKVVFKEGLVARAVRASASIPGVFAPVEHQNCMLVDGAVVERVPAPTARLLGADLVIAVDVGIYVEGQKPNHIIDVITQSLDLMSRDLCRYSLEEADIVISPALQDLSPGHFHRAQYAILAGEQAARESLPSVRELLRKEGVHA